MNTYMDTERCQQLAAAIVVQAVEDWRKLCKNYKMTKRNNFTALEQFFKSRECAIYLEHTTIAQEALWEKMQKERREAICKRLTKLSDGLHEALELTQR